MDFLCLDKAISKVKIYSKKKMKNGYKGIVMTNGKNIFKTVLIFVYINIFLVFFGGGWNSTPETWKPSELKKYMYILSAALCWFYNWFYSRQKKYYFISVTLPK